MKYGELEKRIFHRTADLANVAPTEITAETTLESVGLNSSDAVILAMEVEEFAGVEVDVGTFLRFETLGEAIADLARVLNNDVSG